MPLRILLVEDDRGNAIVVQAFCAIAGFDVLRSTEIDLVLMDVHLPGIDASQQEEPTVSKPTQVKRAIQYCCTSLALLCASGCAAPTAPAAATLSAAKLQIRALELDSQRLVGAERFSVTVVVEVPNGRYVKAIGLRTPYEQSVRPLRQPLPMAISQGSMILRSLYFTEVPVTGPYPFEVWLVNEAGQASNRVSGLVHIQ